MGRGYRPHSTRRRKTLSFGASPLAASGTRLVVGRIAKALGVSPGVLYEVPTLEGQPTASNAGVSTTEVDLDGECAALLNAYRRIGDPEKRRRLLILAQEAAERSTRD